MLNAALDRASTLAGENTELRRHVRSLQDQNVSLQERFLGRGLFADPDKQLRHEIYLHYLVSVPAQERDELPLREYRLGADFPSSVDGLDIDRARVVEASVDILTGRVWGSNSRQPHQFMDSPLPGGKAWVRPDGAVAWRAYLQVNTPQARRIMWWELTDGTVELSRASTHDDFTALR